MTKKIKHTWIVQQFEGGMGIVVDINELSSSDSIPQKVQPKDMLNFLRGINPPSAKSKQREK